MTLQNSLFDIPLQTTQVTALSNINLNRTAPAQHGTPQSQRFTRAGSPESRGLRLSVGRIMGLLEQLSDDQKLAGVEIAHRLDVLPRAVQRVLPSLAIKGHVCREKRIMPAGQRDVYVYWLNDAQRLRRHKMGQSRQGVPNTNPNIYEQSADELRAQVIELRCQIAEAKKNATPTQIMHSGPGIDISEKWHFLKKLLKRPALADFKLLHDIERDYRHSLQRARGVD